jgi:hypothetical protein
MTTSMGTPLRPPPPIVARWRGRMRWLRWLDALAAWVALWLLAGALLDGVADGAVWLASIVLFGGVVFRPLRVRWRPVSGAVAVAVSRRVRPGDRAWYVRAGEADLVLVTARRGLRAVIARPSLEAEEGLGVRRTRVILLPADED